GQSQVTLSLAVESGVLLDLGHADSITELRLTSTRALSQDGSGRWVLWDLSTGDLLASGEVPCRTAPPCYSPPLPVDLAGETVAIQTPTGLELRATADGHLLATISAPIASWRLATDGTYVTAASSFGLTAWSPAGAVLVTRSGD